GLVGALVDAVEESVLVIVGIRAAVVVLERVLVLGDKRTLVGHVGHAVLVVVGIGTAVLVLEAVLVFGIRGALVQAIDDAVAVGVDVGRRLLDGRRRGRRRRGWRRRRRRHKVGGVTEREERAHGRRTRAAGQTRTDPALHHPGAAHRVARARDRFQRRIANAAR